MTSAAPIDSTLEIIKAPRAVFDFAALSPGGALNDSYFDFDHELGCPIEGRYNFRRTSQNVQPADENVVASPSRKKRKTMSLGKEQPKSVLRETTNFHGRTKFAKTPMVLKRGLAQRRAALKRAENDQKQVAAQMKQELHNVLADNQENYNKLKSAKIGVPRRNVQEATKTEEFRFATDSRVKPHTSTQEEPANFISNLRKPETCAAKKTTTDKITIPQPFKLSQNKRKRVPSESTEYRSLAQNLIAFEKGTPERFHTKSNHNESVVLGGRRQLTQAKTPKLSTRARHRPAHVQSAAEIEELQIQDNKKNQFKAQPINNKVSVKPQQPQIKKTLTVAKPFKLTEVTSKPVVEEERYEFHARPLPSAILAGKVGIPQIVSAPVTNPKTPRFALKGRMLTRSMKPEETVEEEKKKGVSLKPHQGLKNTLRGRQSPAPKAIVEARPQNTTMVPFSFDAKDKRRYEIKEKNIKKVISEEKKLHEFHAKPLIVHDAPVGLPPREVKQSTVPEPFHIHNIKKRPEPVEEKKPEFHAAPAKVLKQAPFVPASSDRAPTQPAEFTLNTEVRSEKREEIDKLIKQQEAEKLAAALRREEEDAILEEQRLREEREKRVHKAKPVSTYKPLTVLPSDRNPTVPKTPKFSKRFQK